jgi:hypothetical protein
VPFGQLVEIEQDLFGGLHALLAAAHVGILLPLFRSRVVVVRTDSRWDAQVGLLDPPEHLLVKRVLQALGRGHDRIGERVLCLEVLDDLGVGLFPEPEVVVHERVAVDFGLVRFLCGHGWSIDGFLTRRCWRQEADCQRRQRQR